MSMITCCKDCKLRTPGCHDKCEEYIQEKAEWNRAKAYLRGADVEYRDYRRENVQKTMDARAMRKRRKRGYPTCGGD